MRLPLKNMTDTQKKIGLLKIIYGAKHTPTPLTFEQSKNDVRFLLSLIDSAPPKLKGFEWKTGTGITQRDGDDYENVICLSIGEINLGVVTHNPDAESWSWVSYLTGAMDKEPFGSITEAKEELESTVRSELQSLFSAPPKAETGDVDFEKEAMKAIGIVIDPTATNTATQAIELESFLRTFYERAYSAGYLAGGMEAI